MQETTLEVNISVEGETIEQKIERILENNDPITDGAPIIYTERKDGVQPEYDIRTDRFDIALEGTDYISKSKLATREEKAEAQRQAREGALKDGKDGKTESTQGQDPK